MIYTISELAKLAGISTRTLRYYDEINLISPSFVNDAGYRLYDQQAVDTLQQVLFYRELKLDLKTIQRLLSEADGNVNEVLTNQFEALTAERAHINELLKILEKTIQANKGETKMTNEEKFAQFKQDLVSENENEYGDEIRNNYGDHAVDTSNAKMLGMDETTYKSFKNLEMDLKHDLLLAAVQTQDVSSPEAESLVRKHREWLGYTWSEYSPEAHQGLADMYIADERFKMYYDESVPGGAQFLHDAIDYWSNKI